MAPGGKLKNGRPRGQVLLLSIAVMVVLLIAAILLFDLHNGIRAKIKVETAQQAAALAGAQWQVAGLNMLGELNIVKACTMMLTENSEITATPYVPPEDAEPVTGKELEYEKKLHRLESRLRTLNEAQSRVAFILPLLGYAAVQQTAKQNGMSDSDGVLKHYSSYTLPLNDHRNKHIQGYFWYEPYSRLVSEIAEQRAVVRCNARVSEMPEVWSNPQGSRKIFGGEESSFSLLLSEESLYDAIANKNFCHWQLKKIAKQNVHLDSPWWHISYIPGAFIEESELLPLGIRYSGGVSVSALQEEGLLQGLSGPSPWNLDEDLQPDTWCLYDSKWYSSAWTQEAYDSQQTNWRGSRWLRNDRLPGFLYEGAVTAVDGSVDSARIMTFHARKQGTAAAGENSAPGKFNINAPLRERSNTNFTVGRTSTQRGVNLGVVAKVLGGFNDLRSKDDAPTVTPVVLPVFSRGLLVPSSMPYNVTMLTQGDHSLKRFLKWLATWPDIHNSTPPSGTEWYLIQLRKLMDPDFILSIYNPDFPGLDSIPQKDLFDNDYYYPTRSDGAGWLQRAYRCFVTACPTRIQYTGRRLKCGNCDICKKQPSWVKGKVSSCGEWEVKRIPAVPDDVPAELPQTYVDDKGLTQRYYTDYNGTTRIYYGNQKSGFRYCIKRNGKILTNEDISCNGHLYVPPGGGMSIGIESGPSRL